MLQVNTVLMIEALGRAGQISHGLAAVEEAIAQSGETDGGWLIAELLRIKGGLLALQGALGAEAAAEDLFQRALHCARRHEPRPAVARSGPFRGGDGAPPAGPRPLD